MLKIDSREQSMIKKVIKKANELGVKYELTTLPVGDYMWEENGIVIERKTVEDFINSIRDGRLETQLLDMNDQCEHPYLFICGLFKDVYMKPYMKKSGWTTKHTVGSLCSINARYNNVKAIQFESEAQMIDAIFKIQEKTSKGGKINSMGIKRHSKTLTVIDPNLHLYTCLIGVGETKAKKYMLDYPLFSDFLNAYKDGKLCIKLSKSTQIFMDKMFGKTTVLEYRN